MARLRHRRQFLQAFYFFVTVTNVLCLRRSAIRDVVHVAVSGARGGAQAAEGRGQRSGWSGGESILPHVSNRVVNFKLLRAVMLHGRMFHYLTLS